MVITPYDAVIPQPERGLGEEPPNQSLGKFVKKSVAAGAVTVMSAITDTGLQVQKYFIVMVAIAPQV